MRYTRARPLEAEPLRGLLRRCTGGHCDDKLATADFTFVPATDGSAWLERIVIRPAGSPCYREPDMRAIDDAELDRYDELGLSAA